MGPGNPRTESGGWEELAKRSCGGRFTDEKGEKKALEKDLREKHADGVWQGSGLKERNEAMGEGLVAKALATAGKTEKDPETGRKGVPWKAKVAREGRTRPTAGDPRIAGRLTMGHPSRGGT